MMIGQTKLKNTIKEQANSGSFARFNILVGPQGSGKKLICKFIATTIHATPYYCGTGVDDIRKMIDESYKISAPMLYIIADADKMSIAAKNALLKVTEEPPQNAYFIMTLTDLSNTLGTIKSRGNVLYMDAYTVDELIECGREATDYTLHDDEAHIIENICETPGEVKFLFRRTDVGYARDFYHYVELTVDNIATVSGANSFKIASKIAFKGEPDKYDMKLFLKAFMAICTERLKEDSLKYAAGIKVTSKYLQDLRITGINKQSTFDMWILDIRQEWM